MRNTFKTILLALGLLPTLAVAQVANFPQTLPPNTVVGRLGLGTSGPSQAIPFATLAAQLSGSSTIQPVLNAAAADNSVALNAAIARCTALGGGTILIPVGNYQYSSALTISSQGCNLIGVGRSSKLTYTGTGIGLTISGGLDTLRIGDLTLAASSSSATILKIYGVNAAIAIQGVKFTGGNTQLLIDGAPGSGSYGIDISLCNFEGSTTVAKSISIAPSTAGYAQAITIRQNEFSGFNQAIYHTGSDAISIFGNRIERHFVGTGAAIHTDTSNGVTIVDNYMEDENSNKPFIESGSSVAALTVLYNRFYPNVGGGTHTGAGVLKTTATASSITFSYNYIQSLSALSVLGNVVDTGASKIFGRANTFNIGTAAYGFASTATSADVDIDGTKVVAGTFSSAQQQVGVGRMAVDVSNAAAVANGNRVFVSPNGAAGVPTFRALAGADLPLPTASTKGGIFSIAVASKNYLTGISSVDGSISSAQPAISDLQNIAANSVLGNNTGSSAPVIALTQAQHTAMINLATASLSGALPAWPNNTTTFLRGDGTYATPVTKTLLAAASINTLAQNTTGFFWNNVCSATEATCQVPLDTAGTIQSATFTANSAPVAGQTYIFTVRKNGVNTAITCTISNPATKCSDTVHATAYSTGDLISVQVALSATAGANGFALGITITQP